MDNQAPRTSAAEAQSGHWYRVNHDETVTPAPRTVLALHNEHAYMFKLLDSLDEQAGMITRGEDADFGLLLDIVDYMQNFPSRYHHPKEDLIYQRMALRDDVSALEVAALLEEHRVLERLLARLADAIRDVHTMPTVLKKQRVGETCSQYEQLLKEHINTEESRILPRAIEVLREEDWFLIDQQSTPLNEIPIDNILTDNYSSLRRLLREKSEKLANNVVLGEFLASHSLLEFVGGLGVSLAYGQEAYSHGVHSGLSAYWKACKSWMPFATAPDSGGFQNPVRVSWDAFVQGMAEVEKPDAELLQPMKRAVNLYRALIGGRGASVAQEQLAEGEEELDLNSMHFLEDASRLVQ